MRWCCASRIRCRLRRAPRRRAGSIRAPEARPRDRRRLPRGQGHHRDGRGQPVGSRAGRTVRNGFAVPRLPRLPAVDRRAGNRSFGPAAGRIQSAWNLPADRARIRCLAVAVRCRAAACRASCPVVRPVPRHLGDAESCQAPLRRSPAALPHRAEGNQGSARPRGTGRRGRDAAPRASPRRRVAEPPRDAAVATPAPPRHHAAAHPKYAAAPHQTPAPSRAPASHQHDAANPPAPPPQHHAAAHPNCVAAPEDQALPCRVAT